MSSEDSERERPPGGHREPPGQEPSDRDPHHALNNPVGEPDPTEWPDPYDRRPDPRDPEDFDPLREAPPHTPTGAVSSSEPHPAEDPEAIDWKAPPEP